MATTRLEAIAMTSLPDIISRPCMRCAEIVDLLYHPSAICIRIPRAPARATIVPNGDPVLCPSCLFFTLSEEGQTALADSAMGFATMRVRAGLPPGVTAWILPAVYLDATAHTRGAGIAVEVSAPPPPTWPLPWIAIGGHALVFVSLFFADSDAVGDGVQPMIEARWPASPTFHDRVIVEVLGWRHVHKLSDLERLMDGMRFIHEFDRAGRPRGDRELSPEEFWNYDASARRRCRAAGQKPTDNNLAQFMPISKSSIVRYRKDYAKPKIKQ